MPEGASSSDGWTGILGLGYEDRWIIWITKRFESSKVMVSKNTCMSDNPGLLYVTMIEGSKGLSKVLYLKLSMATARPPGPGEWNNQ